MKDCLFEAIKLLWIWYMGYGKTVTICGFENIS